MLKLLIAALLCAASLAVAAQTVRLGSVTNSRFGTNWTLDGGQMANTRAKLLNTANFGPGGTYGKSVVITDTAATIDSVTASLLSNFDVLFIGYLYDGSPNAFTPAELSAMQTWVNGGGTMVVTCDASNYDAVCAAFGHPSSSSGSGVNPTIPTAAGTAHILFNGPFGTVTAINGSGTQGWFSDTTGATILGQDSAVPPKAVVLVQSFGAGRVVFLGDVDLIANAATGGPTITSQNDRFLGNLLAWGGGTGSGAGSPYSRSYVQKAYVSYYGRPADPAGQGYWAQRMDAEGSSLDSIIGAFGVSAEFSNRYGGLTNTQLITKIYQQTLGRDPDPAGLAYYLGELGAGRKTLQTITLDVLNGATTPPDSTVVANKLQVADYYTGKIALGCSYGTELDGVNSLAPVTADPATVTAAKAAIDVRCP